MLEVRLRYKLAIILPFGLGGLAFVSKLRDGHDAVSALTATHTIVVFCCGSAAAIIFWLLARWLDNVPDSPYSLEDMIEIVEEHNSPSNQFFMGWAKQLLTGVSRSVQFCESKPMPMPNVYGKKKYPSFDQVIRSLKPIKDNDGHLIDAIDLVSDDIDKSMYWQITGEEPERVLKLWVKDGPVPNVADETASGHTRTSTSTSRPCENPLSHTSERMAELRGYTGGVRGNFWRTFLLGNLALSIVPGITSGTGWYISDPKLYILAVLFAFVSFVISLLISIISKLSRIEISDGQMRFVFAGLTRRQISLASIDGFECTFGHKGMIRIIYGKQWHCPSGLISHRQIADLLESCGIHKIQDD
jgi:hypothetical protein